MFVVEQKFIFEILFTNLWSKFKKQTQVIFSLLNQIFVYTNIHFFNRSYFCLLHLTHTWLTSLRFSYR